MHVDMGVDVCFLLFFSKLLSRIAVGYNFHSMLQCYIENLFYGIGVVSHDCIVPCCLCCFVVVMCHERKSLSLSLSLCIYIYRMLQLLLSSKNHKFNPCFSPL